MNPTSSAASVSTQNMPSSLAALWAFMAKTAARLVRASDSLVLNSELVRIMSDTGSFTGMEGGCILLFTGAENSPEPSYVWRRDPTSTAADLSISAAFTLWQRYAPQDEQAAPFALSTADHAQELRPQLEAHGVNWLIFAPLRGDESLLGVLCFEAGTADSGQISSLLPLFDGLAQIISGALIRKNAAAEDHTLLRILIDHIPDYIHIKDTQGRFLLNNRAHLRMLGAARQEDVLGMTDFDFFPAEDVTAYYADERQIIETGEPLINREEPVTDADGNRRWQLTTKVPFRNSAGQIIGQIGINRDITNRKIMEEALRHSRDELEQRVAERTADLQVAYQQLQQQMDNVQRAEEERARLQQEVIEAQQRAIQELSTPVIPIMDGIIVMPLIGSIDTLRARDITRSLLNGITSYRARVVILDITGVPIVDSGVATHLDRTIQAARLKGAHTIITGISDSVAETIVDLGIDWKGVETLRDLRTGLVTALGRVGMRLVHRSG